MPGDLSGVWRYDRDRDPPPVTPKIAELLKTKRAALPGGGGEQWSMESIKVGDKLPVTVHPMKDGSLYALMAKTTTPRGETLKNKD